MDKLKQNKYKQPLLWGVVVFIACLWVFMLFNPRAFYVAKSPIWSLFLIGVSGGLAFLAIWKLEDTKQKPVDDAKTFSGLIEENLDSSLKAALERRKLDAAILMNPVSIYRDEQTGLEYLIAPNGSMLPRLDADGKQICVKETV